MELFLSLLNKQNVGRWSLTFHANTHPVSSLGLEIAIHKSIAVAVSSVTLVGMYINDVMKAIALYNRHKFYTR